MGSGIAQVSSDKAKMNVLLKDQNLILNIENQKLLKNKQNIIKQNQILQNQINILKMKKYN